MSSRDEELKKYLAKRERKKNRQNVVDEKEWTPFREEGKRDPSSFKTYFELRNGQSRMIVTAFIAVALCIGLIVFLNYAEAEPTTILGSVIFLFLFINLLSLGGLYTGFAAYQKFASGKDSPVRGWNNFLVGRSNDFWNGGYYALVQIKFDQDHTVPELERQALNAFTQTWINEWGFRYKGKWTYGAPKEFDRVGADRIEGHVSISEGVPFMMDQFIDKLPDLVRLITPGSLTITLSSIGSELSTSGDTSAEDDEERRSDQRHREMMQRNDD